MLGKNKKESDFKSRKEYLIYLAIHYIHSHTGYMGIDDYVFFDEAECDGYALANDLADEFDFDIDDVLNELV
jgi:hypothetical protein